MVVAFAAIILLMIAFASVVVPNTVSVPVVEALPSALTMKLVFSVHADPFQYKVLLVAVPALSPPETLVQYVEVPFVASTCPGVPVALFESRSSPVIRNLAIVEEESTVRLETLSVLIVVVASVEVP